MTFEAGGVLSHVNAILDIIITVLELQHLLYCSTFRFAIINATRP